MGENKVRDWTKVAVIVGVAVAIVTLACMVLAMVPPWVAFLEDRGYDAAWLSPYLQWLRRWWRLLAVGLVSTVAGLVLWRVGKRFYLWVLWQVVVRPARDYWGVVVGEDARVGPSAGQRVSGGHRGGLGATIVGLSEKALRVLRRVLVEYDPALGGTVAWRPSSLDMDELLDNLYEDFGALQRAACEELEDAGLFSRVDFGLREAGAVTIDLDQQVLDAGVLRVRELLEDELRSR